MTSVIDFIDDPNLLGSSFTGDSWDRWRAVLRAAYALPMTAKDRRLFAEVAGDRAPPQRVVEELVAIVGRSGGKDSVAAALACFVAVTGDFGRFRPGERAVVFCLACDRDQAAIVFNYIRAYFKEMPLLAGLVTRLTADTVELSNGASIIVATNSFRAVRGRTIACAIYDEVAYWRDDRFVSPDSETDAAITPGLMRWPGSIKILISSPYRRAGLLWTKWKQSFGQDDDGTLVVLGTSPAIQPDIAAREGRA